MVDSRSKPIDEDTGLLFKGGEGKKLQIIIVLLYRLLNIKEGFGELLRIILVIVGLMVFIRWLFPAI